MELAISCYILIALVFFYCAPSLVECIIKYFQSETPLPRSVVVMAVILALPILSVQILIGILRRFFRGKDDSESYSEEASRFFEEYYPEAIYDLTEVAIELDIEDIDEFIRMLSSLFEAGFGESRITAIMQDTQDLPINDYNRHVFYTTYQSKRTPMVVEFKRIRQHIYAFFIQSEQHVTPAIESVMDRFCE